MLGYGSAVRTSKAREHVQAEKKRFLLGVLFSFFCNLGLLFFCVLRELNSLKTETQYSDTGVLLTRTLILVYEI